MIPDKELKNRYKPVFWKDPEKYYATAVLKSEGFHRMYCSACSRPFWNTDAKRKVCGDPSCAPGESFAFIGKTPAKRSLTYIETWKEFSTMFKKFGYTSVKRYPVVARWNPTADFTIASISAFQPYVISGEINPPANPLVIPQFCLRFGDIDNVGITQSHMTGFVMIGQHMFVPPEKWDQNQVFRDIFAWLKDGLLIPVEEITFHEDAWAGGGNLGCCMEFFSRGCEIGNQVYMLYEQTEKTPAGIKDLNLKVLDMGMGMERSAWFSQGSSTIYDATFPATLKKLFAKTGVKIDKGLMKSYVPHAGRLNVDEVEHMDAAWNEVARRVGIPVNDLREAILPLSGVYSIAEHARSLLFALNDGALPSNVGGGYNLRVLARRALSFIEHYKWNIRLSEVCRWHAAELKPLFPELSKHLDDVEKILEVEKAKYEAGRQKSRHIVERIAGEDVSPGRLIELYDSQGITPELIEEEAKKKGRVVKIPENFYALVAQKHEGENEIKKNEIKNKPAGGFDEEKLPLEGLAPTKALYYGDWKKLTFGARVVKVLGRHVVLDETSFYPTSGGQEHDQGWLLAGTRQFRVVNVFKQGAIIVHVLDIGEKGSKSGESKSGDSKNGGSNSLNVESKNELGDESKSGVGESKNGVSENKNEVGENGAALVEGESVKGTIDKDRRFQLAKHHTATHILNAAARRILGNHINQAGARKTEEKATLDITHFESLSDDQIHAIEDEANRIITQSIPMRKSFVPRDKAEKEYGMEIYQGGAVPGKLLRIVEIPEVDVEACGGTHLDNTAEAEHIKILKSQKIQDGVVRLTFVAGPAAKKAGQEVSGTLQGIAKMLGCQEKQVPGRCRELFEKWKSAKKASEKGSPLSPSEVALQSTEETETDILHAAAQLLKTQPEHLEKTVERFLKDLKVFVSKNENEKQKGPPDRM